MKKTVRELNMEEIIKETIWMARRYAHKRRTYAPSIVNGCIELALKLGIKIEPDTVDGIEMYADDGDLGKWNPETRMFIKESPHVES